MITIYVVDGCLDLTDVPLRGSRYQIVSATEVTDRAAANLGKPSIYIRLGKSTPLAPAVQQSGSVFERLKYRDPGRFVGVVDWVRTMPNTLINQDIVKDAETVFIVPSSYF